MFSDRSRQKCDQLFDRYYKGRKFCRTLYCEMIRKYLAHGDRVLDAGCGRYLEFSRELPADAEVVGIDLESTLETRNQRSPYGVRGDLEHLPFPSNHFNLVISRSVVEHLHNPAKVFQEFHRILKPGGKVILSTPNKYDYVSIIAAITPYILHRKLVSRALQVSEEDVFPTLYRANTISALRKHLTSAGFLERDLDAINHYPVYLMFSPLLFRLGVVYERVTSLGILRSLRGTLLCAFEKPAADTAFGTGVKRQQGTEAGVSVVGS